MKRLFVACLMVPFFFGTPASAQAPEDPAPAPLISGITLFPMANVQSNPLLGLNDFKTLAPNSALLANPDFYGKSSFSNSLQTGNGGLSLLLNFKEKGKDFGKTAISSGFRLGVNYQSRTFNTSFSDIKKGVIDTLRPSGANEMIYLDTVFQQSLDLSYRSDVIGLDVSYLYRINPHGRWSFFAGLGMQLGASFSNQTNILYNKFRYKEYREEDGNIIGSSFNNDRNNFTLESENVRNAIGFNASAFVPLGVDFRIGKTSEFWRRTHLFYELRPLINVMSIPSVGTFTSAGIQHGLGLRVTVL